MLMRHAPRKKNGAYQVVISNATMMSSFKTSEVNEMETMLRNSVSKSTRDTSMIAAPGVRARCEHRSGPVLLRCKSQRTLVYADHEPLKECLVRERSTLKERKKHEICDLPNMRARIHIECMEPTRGEERIEKRNLEYAHTLVSSLYNSGYINAKSSFTSVSNTNEKTGAIV